MAAPAIVREDFRRDLVNGCEYRARVRGTVRVAEGYTPVLRVESEVHCPGVPVTRQGARAVRGRELTGAALAHRLNAAGTLWAKHEGRVCVYAPAFDVRNGVPAGRTVAFNCRDERTGATSRS